MVTLFKYYLTTPSLHYNALGRARMKLNHRVERGRRVNLQGGVGARRAGGSLVYYVYKVMESLILMSSFNGQVSTNGTTMEAPWEADKYGNGSCNVSKGV